MRWITGHVRQSSAAIVLLFAAAISHPSARAAEKQKSEVFRTISPDKLYEVRETGDDAEMVSSSALYARKSGERLINLAAVHQLKGVENTETLWRGDSRAFAFHYAFLKSGSTVIYRKEGAAFKALPLPKLPPMRTDTGKEIPDVDLNIRADTVYPIRWLKGGVLILEEFRIYGGGEWETTHRKITVSVPEKGPLVIKKVERIDISQREEINR